MNDLNLHSQLPIADDVTRELPYALQPEKSVLSYILQDPQEFLTRAIEEGITESHFYLPQHQTLYSFVLDIFQENEEIEMIGLVQRLLDAGKLEKCGGAGYIVEINSYSFVGGHFDNHLHHIKNKYILRSLIRASNNTVAAVYEEPEDPSIILDEAERQILSIRESSSKEEDISNKAILREITKEMIERAQGNRPAATGVLTQFEDLDRMTGGFKPGELIIIAARPSMGKTSLLMNIIENMVIGQDLPSLVFSAEMPKKQILERLTYGLAGFSASIFLRGEKLTEEQGKKFKSATIKIANAPLFIDDKASPTINEIRAKARRMHRKHGIKVIGLDYLQLCKSTSKQAMGSREREISDISSGLKALAKELNIPIIVLAQLNRDAEKRTGKSKGRPQMSDLRESGAIEQDADVIGMLTRPAYYAATDAEKESLAGKAELIIAKNRNGGTGSVNMTFIENLMKFKSGAPIITTIIPNPVPAPVDNRFNRIR
jgi:replicative DNA helicase